MRFRTPLAVACVVCIPYQARAAPPDAPTQAPTLTTSTSLVVVPALVRDASGQLVYALKADDFVLTDDGVPHALRLEQDTGGEPLALAVVIEAGAATRAAGWHPYTHTPPPDRFRGVPAMVDAMTNGVPHRTAVIGFDSQPELELPFTADSAKVADVIQQLNQGDSGDHGAGILDAVVFAVDLLRSAPPGYRRAILLLCETNDRGSHATLEGALRSITETNTAIYSVAFSTPFHQSSEYGTKQLPTKTAAVGDVQQRKNAEEAYAPNPANPDQEIAQRILQGVMFGFTLQNPAPNPANGCMGAEPGAPRRSAREILSQAYDCLGQLAPPLALARMAAIAATGTLRQNVPEAVARLTGGEYFEFNTAKSLEADLATLANHLPNRYILTFQPQNPHPGLHVLTLALKDYPQLKVTARTSYWADSAPTE